MSEIKDELKEQAEPLPEMQNEVQTIRTIPHYVGEIKDELKEQADAAQIDFANIVNEISGKKPTEYQIQAAEHFANQVMVSRKIENPEMTDEAAKKELVALKLEALRSGDLKELSDEMTADLKDPSRMERRQKTSAMLAAVFHGERD